MRGYFGIGVERISKAANVGAVLRTAHAFEANFAFTISPQVDASEFRQADTSVANRNMPVYTFSDVESMTLPQGCEVVAIELHDDAVDLPSFRHPRRAAYILGSERGGLSDALIDRADYIVKIPTRFSINLSLAGALVMYDRLITVGRHPARPARPGGPEEALPPHVHGTQIIRNPKTPPQD
jgi:tRNA G18 (ribose-2'-O)-methylase SpoU